MKNILWEVFELIVTLFESGVSTHFVCKFLGLDFSEKTGYKLWYGMILCNATTVITINMITSYEGMLVLIYCLVVFIYSAFLLSGSLIKKAVASILFLCIIIMNSSLGVNLVSSILDTNTSEIYKNSDISRLLTILFVQALDFLTFQVLEKILGDKKLKLKLQEWLLLASVFFVSILAMTLIQVAATNLKSNETLRFCFLGVDFAIIIVDYITIRLITILNHQHQTELENQQMLLQLQYQVQYAETVRQQEESVHRLRHDLKATISALYDFLHQKKFSEAEEFLGTYSTSLMKTASIVRTNQPFLNAILNTKLTYAKENGITCICHSPINLPTINGTDYCSLLGNLLDNAIEASLKSPIREISVTIDNISPKLIITVKNRINESVLDANPYLHTTKGKNKGHGYGITSIRNIALQYNGSVDLYEDNGWFVAAVILYIK